MTRTILGLDIGGANLKAVTPDGRAVSVPFALWKQPDKLPAALAELVGRFPDVGELAVTMTGELCDCYQTKREGVNAILDAVEFAANGRPVRVWGTDGEFLSVAESRAEYMRVAAANWHALATFAGRWVPDETAMLIDMGSTTTDLILLRRGIPDTFGANDYERIRSRELLYTGVRRTPVCALVAQTAAELFATTLDVYLLLDQLPEDPTDRETADGQPATKQYAHARMARMLGGDTELLALADTSALAVEVRDEQARRIAQAVNYLRSTSPVEEWPTAVIISGSGEFLVRLALGELDGIPIFATRSLSEFIGPSVSACAPAYAVAVLASERPS